MKKISVIVPCYKVEQYLPKCVESLCNQTLKDIEMILVDDGSPDNSGKICDEWAAKDERVKVIHKANGGVSAARNDGLRIARGEYVLFCDSDDWMDNDALEALYLAGVKNDADVVIGDVSQVYGDRIVPVHFYDKEFVTSDKTFVDEMIKANFCRKYCSNPYEGKPAFGYGGPWNKAVKREFLIGNNIEFDVRVKGIFDDILYTAYILANAKKIVYIQKNVYNYRILSNSITHSFKANLLDINEAIFNSWDEFLKKYGSDGRFDEAYAANVIRRLKSTLGLYYFSPKNPMSLRQQFKDIKRLIATEPYATAIRTAKPSKLLHKYDELVWRSAKYNSPIGMYLAYQLFVLAKKLGK